MFPEHSFNHWTIIRQNMVLNRLEEKISKIEQNTMNNNEWKPIKTAPKIEGEWISIKLLKEIIYKNKWNYIILLTKKSGLMIGKIEDWSGIYTIVNQQNEQNLLTQIQHDYDDEVTHFIIFKIPPIK